MKVYDLFKNCERPRLFKTIKKNKAIPNLSESVFNDKLDRLLSAYDSEFVSKYHVVFTPYLSTNGSGMEHDLFLLDAKEVSALISRYSPKQTLLFSERVTCDSVSLQELVCSNVCSLSENNFSAYDICAEIFFESLIDITEMQSYTKEEAFDFIQKIKQQFRNPQHPTTDEDVDYVISQNVLFAYPYYSAVVNDIS